MASIRNVKLLWDEKRSADTYRLQWGEGISGSAASNSSLFADNATYLVTGIEKAGVITKLYTTGSIHWPEDEKLILYGFPTGRSGINSSNIFYGDVSGDYFEVINNTVPDFPFEATTGYMTYGKQKRTELITADHTKTTYSGELYDISRSGDIITGYYSGLFTGLNTGDTVSLDGFYTGVVTDDLLSGLITGDLYEYANLNNDYIVQETGAGYFTLSGSGDNFSTGQYTGENGYLIYEDYSSYSGELVIAQEFSLKQSANSDPQTSYIWRVRAENIYSQSDWEYGQFFTPNLPAAPTGAVIISPPWHQSGIDSNITRNDKLAVEIVWSGDPDADYFNIEYGYARYQYQPIVTLLTSYDNEFGPITGRSATLFLDYNTGYSFRIVSKNIGGSATSATGLLFTQPEPSRDTTYYLLDSLSEEELKIVLNEANFQFKEGLISGYNVDDLQRNVITGGNLNNYLYQGEIYDTRATGFVAGIDY
jgi:hypothetical protein